MRMRRWIGFCALWTAGFIMLPYGAVECGVLFVDRTLGTNCPGNYDSILRACGGGSSTAYNTLEGAAQTAQPGDNVVLRGGAYSSALNPNNSGNAAQYIVYQNYPGEEPLISGPSLSPAVNISNKQHIVIEGLRIEGVSRWMYALNAHNNIIRNNMFLRALDSGGSSKTGLFFQDATRNKILNNVIEDSTQDHLSLIRSERNLVEGNAFRKAAHTLWTIKCGNFNVLRNNYFHNQIQKIGEIYDCDAVGFDHEITALNATKYNLVEGNEFAYTPSSGNSSPYAGIQYAGQNGIIRFNRFHDTVGPALDLTLYSGEALYNTGNRVYHNVFFSTDFAGVSLAAGSTFSGNEFKNNILAGSRFVANDTRWSWYVNELNGKYVQLLTGRKDGFLFAGNAFFGSAGNDEPYLVTNGVRTSSNNGAQHSLAWWQTNYPSLFRENIEQPPMFVNAASSDFRPSNGSPMIDAGVFLTRTVGAGSGTTLVVADAGYFYDGYGIPGEVGDLIQLEGQAETARIVQVNYSTKTLTLSRSLSWVDGQGVHLRYAGARPDIGAYEYGAGDDTGSAVPRPPTDLLVH